MKFEKYFKEVRSFTGGIHVVSGYIDKDVARGLFEESTGRDVPNNKVRSDYVRFGFPPMNIEDREDFDGQPIWYTGADGKGSKPVWVYNIWDRD